MDKTVLQDAIARELCIALEIMEADATLPHETSAGQAESAQAVYLRKCDDAIRRAAREMKDGWN